MHTFRVRSGGNTNVVRVEKGVPRKLRASGYYYQTGVNDWDYAIGVSLVARNRDVYGLDVDRAETRQVVVNGRVLFIPGTGLCHLVRSAMFLIDNKEDVVVNYHHVHLGWVPIPLTRAKTNARELAQAYPALILRTQVSKLDDVIYMQPSAGRADVASFVQSDAVSLETKLIRKKDAYNALDLDVGPDLGAAALRRQLLIHSSDDEYSIHKEVKNPFSEQGDAIVVPAAVVFNASPYAQETAASAVAPARASPSYLISGSKLVRRTPEGDPLLAWRSVLEFA